MRNFPSKNTGLLGAAAVLLFLVTLLLVEVSSLPAIPVPTWTLTPPASETPTTTHTLTPLPKVAQVDTLLLTTPTLEPGNSCPPALEDIQGVLQTALPKIYWGVTYAGRGYTRLWFLGVSTGETATRTVEGSSGASWKIDLARFYFLHADGTLDSVWVALGFAPGDTSSSTTAIYSTFNDLPQAGWFSSHEALTRLSVPGQVFDIGFPDAFVDQSGIHWDQCRALARFIPGDACDLGPVLDPNGSTGFISSGIPRKDEILFGFELTPNDQMTWLYPVPDTIALPETCP